MSSFFGFFLCEKGKCIPDKYKEYQHCKILQYNEPLCCGVVNKCKVCSERDIIHDPAFEQQPKPNARNSREYHIECYLSIVGHFCGHGFHMKPDMHSHEDK